MNFTDNDFRLIFDAHRTEAEMLLQSLQTILERLRLT
jgi:hypothetical protein